jgi:hypothetical protein
VRAVVLTLVALALAGCPGVDRPDPLEDTDAGADVPAWPQGDFEIGTSSLTDPTAWQAMPASVQLVPGFQGGFHVPVMYRVSHHDAANVTFEHKVRRVSDGVLVSRGGRGFDVASDGGTWTSDYEVTIFMCPTPVGVTVVDEALNLEVRILSQDSKLLGLGTAQVVVHCPAGDSFCQSICKG